MEKEKTKGVIIRFHLLDFNFLRLLVLYPHFIFPFASFRYILKWKYFIFLSDPS